MTCIAPYAGEGITEGVLKFFGAQQMALCGGTYADLALTMPASCGDGAGLFNALSGRLDATCAKDCYMNKKVADHLSATHCASGPEWGNNCKTAACEALVAPMGSASEVLTCMEDLLGQMLYMEASKAVQ